ncbi:uncharacterized protein LOC119072957 [Bradysia coprophila]|uniref:uncharacterized protein LOC119072957 n=1 Tax=Bradysia coprophila TaxID=38358 RepID=UPI00187D8392|nr:uncharacterized protein LOC119072957 [Bradysia coprophila]
MKIPFVFLVICVVVSFALPERNRSVNNDVREQAEQQQEPENFNQEAAVVNDELIDNRDENLDEKIISSNQTAAEGDKRNNWIRRRHNRRFWLRNVEGRRGRNSTDEMNKGERRHPIMHTTIWQEAQTLLPGNGIFGTENSHRRHHHRHHHHHHHKNCTTTTVPPSTTTTTTPTPMSEMEEMALYRHLTPN